MAIKPSPCLALFLLLSHAIVAIVVYLTAMPPAAVLAMFVLVLLSLFYHLARDALLLFPDSWQEISFDQGCMSVVTRGGSDFSGRIASKTAVNPYFVVLHVRPDGHCLQVSRAIFQDMLGADEFRELRVRLRFAQ
ncbi:MAG TPA: protein YgfX [Gallionella sp.]|nr:protein YgfX [Gallionella sp.]